MEGYVSLGVAARSLGLSLNTYQEAFYLSRTKGLVTNQGMQVPLPMIDRPMSHVPIELWRGGRFFRPGNEWLQVIDGRLVEDFFDYAATKDGHIWSRRPRTHEERILGVAYWRKLRPRANKHGAFTVGMTNAEGYVTRKVHRVVLETYTRTKPEGKEACHRNGDYSDNSISNLFWGTLEDVEANKKTTKKRVKEAKNR